jgi:hypothetical protein
MFFLLSLSGKVSRFLSFSSQFTPKGWLFFKALSLFYFLAAEYVPFFLEQVSFFCSRGKNLDQQLWDIVKLIR